MDARLESRTICPHRALKFVIPIGPVFIHDLLQDGLEDLYRVVVCKLTYDMIDEVSTLVTQELDWASVTALEMLVHEFRHGCRRVVGEGFSLDPFGAVVHCHDNIPISCLGRGWFERAYKIQTPFLKRVQRKNQLVWHP